MIATKENMKIAKKDFGDRQLQMQCVICDEAFSADPGDYFQYPDDQTFECCQKPMVLGYRYTAFHEIGV